MKLPIKNLMQDGRLRSLQKILGKEEKSEKSNSCHESGEDRCSSWRGLRLDIVKDSIAMSTCH